MINQESKTLRQFSCETTGKNGDKFLVMFSYDMSAIHSGFAVSAGINGGKQKSDKKTIARVRALGIDALNRLIDRIGTDLTGFTDDQETKVLDALNGSDSIDVVLIDELYHVNSVDECNAIDSMLDAYDKATIAGKSKVLNKFNNTLRLKSLESTRDLIRDLRQWFVESGSVLTEGLLRHSGNSTYYKRDIDYIRKARTRVFKALNRKYRPLAR